MPISGINNALTAGQDLYKGLMSKNAEEFSLEKQADKLNTAASEKTKQAESKKNFWDHLTTQVSKNTPKQTEEVKTFEERFADIKRKGDIALHHPLPAIVKDYVNEVKSFINDARQNAYSGKSKDGVFEKLDLVDEKLEKLADELLAEQKPGLNLAASLGELQGLLVDIFV